MISYDIIANAVKEYVELQTAEGRLIDYCYIVHFYQKYSKENKWEECTEIVEYHDEEHIDFMMDFCEGQTEVKDITILALWEVGDIMNHVYNIIKGEKENESNK